MEEVVSTYRPVVLETQGIPRGNYMI
ncbi:uncharacterized protein G2W53_039965 [Senna tora]|uniref:Uncharacterized protein n=1 Tax=Senna tora TaxID=362788 RepID=A0A834SPM1_9FABA|nr:uncharacterized protein G2W53_039965 [Senna tora]